MRSSFFLTYVYIHQSDPCEPVEQMRPLSHPSLSTGVTDAKLLSLNRCDRCEIVGFGDIYPWRPDRCVLLKRRDITYSYFSINQGAGIVYIYIDWSPTNLDHHYFGLARGEDIIYILTTRGRRLEIKDFITTLDSIEERSERTRIPHEQRGPSYMSWLPATSIVATCMRLARPSKNWRDPQHDKWKDILPPYYWY
jgi:hypothetical protein